MLSSKYLLPKMKVLNSGNISSSESKSETETNLQMCELWGNENSYTPPWIMEKYPQSQFFDKRMKDVKTEF